MAAVLEQAKQERRTVVLAVRACQSSPPLAQRVGGPVPAQRERPVGSASECQARAAAACRQRESGRRQGERAQAGMSRE